MAGKTTTKPKVKEEPKIDMKCIDDMLLRLDSAENNIDTAENNIDSMLETIDKLDIDELSHRVEKVEARLGIG